MKVCTIEGCGKQHHGRGFCSTHLKRFRREAGLFKGRGCTIEGCHGTHAGKGYCHLHYYRWRTYGDPLHEVGEKVTPMGERIPVAPLLSYLNLRGGLAEAMHAAGVWDEAEVDRCEKRIARATKRDDGLLDVGMADVIAVKALGTHPAMIWGDVWWAAEEMDLEVAA